MNFLLVFQKLKKATYRTLKSNPLLVYKNCYLKNYHHALSFFLLIPTHFLTSLTLLYIKVIYLNHLHFLEYLSSYFQI